MQNTTFLMPKNAEKCQEYFCKTCDFKCFKKSNYEKHLLTKKHNTTNTTKIQPKNAGKYICDCGKEYRYRGSLHNHKKTCDYKNDDENIELEHTNEVIDLKDHIITKEDDTNLVVKLMKQNSELMEVIKDQNETMKEMIPKIGNNNNNTNNTNNNFNLQVFLNEDCKDALNIMDFISSLQIQLKDLEATGKMGFAESTTNLLIEGLKGLDITKRPIHCSDLKRETLYIKDNDVWEKETDNKEKMTRAVKYLQKESFGVIPDWVRKHPGCARGDNQHNDEYMEIVGNTAGVDKIKDVNKISKKVAKEVTLNKNK
tara:strand:+ start:1690 stop:2628 length:939 start_codon:yes stop_codon:yes gene_type:complete